MPITKDAAAKACRETLDGEELGAFLGLVDDLSDALLATVLTESDGSLAIVGFLRKKMFGEPSPPEQLVHRSSHAWTRRSPMSPSLILFAPPPEPQPRHAHHLCLPSTGLHEHVTALHETCMGIQHNPCPRLLVAPSVHVAFSPRPESERNAPTYCMCTLRQSLVR